MFAVIQLPQFALQAVLRTEPEAWARPVALVDPGLTTPRVIELTAVAAAAGIVRGLTPTQALARCREVVVRHRSLAQESAATEAMLQCAHAFSPRLETTAPGTLTLDLNGLAVLREAAVGGGSDTRSRDWAVRLRDTVSRLGVTPRIGLGATPTLARHAARWCGAAGSGVDESSAGVAVVLAAAAFVAGLPVAALEPSSDAAVILEKWGLRNVGELLALGTEALVDRLGLEGLALCAAASIAGVRPLHLVQPTERFHEMFELEPPVETLEPLLFRLRRLVDSLAQRLDGVGRVAERLDLVLRLESGSRLDRRLTVPEPTRNADALFRMLQTHLEGVRTDAAISGVELEFSPAAPRQRQYDLFTSPVRDPQQLHETLARLSALVGADRVGTPVRENSHRPDAFRLLPPDFESDPGVPARRVPELLRAVPLRRFRPALPAEVESAAGGPFRLAEVAPPNVVTLPGVVAPVPSTRSGAGGSALRPVAIRCAVANGRVTLAVGPWRASGGWWEPGAWASEEWDLQLPDGHGLRLMQGADGWQVTGCVD